MYRMIVALKEGGQLERVFDTSKEDTSIIADRIARAMDNGAKTMTITSLSGNTLILHLPNIGAVTFDKI